MKKRLLSSVTPGQWAAGAVGLAAIVGGIFAFRSKSASTSAGSSSGGTSTGATKAGAAARLSPILRTTPIIHAVPGTTLAPPASSGGGQTDTSALLVPGEKWTFFGDDTVTSLSGDLIVASAKEGIPIQVVPAYPHATLGDFAKDNYASNGSTLWVLSVGSNGLDTDAIQSGAYTSVIANALAAFGARLVVVIPPHLADLFHQGVQSVVDYVNGIQDSGAVVILPTVPIDQQQNGVPTTAGFHAWAANIFDQLTATPAGG